LFLSAAVSLVAWLSIFGLMAIFLRNWKADRSAFRYLADASYWIYIVHLPLVGLSHIALQQAPIGALSKFLLTAFITLIVAVLSYQTCVRYTWIGRALNGARTRGIRDHQQSGPGGRDPEIAIERQPFDDAVVPVIIHDDATTGVGDRRAA
jgi:peptidoglycan/LPS O-acetylase OafA/YrhL